MLWRPLPNDILFSRMKVILLVCLTSAVLGTGDFGYGDIRPEEFISATQELFSRKAASSTADDVDFTDMIMKDDTKEKGRRFRLVKQLKVGEKLKLKFLQVDIIIIFRTMCFQRLLNRLAVISALSGGPNRASYYA